MSAYASSAAPVSASAPKGKGDAPRKPGDLLSIHIDVAENGFVGSCRHEPPKPKKGEYPGYAEPAQYVLADVDAVKAFIDQKVGGAKKKKA